MTNYPTVCIESLTEQTRQLVKNHFSLCIPLAFELQGLGDLKSVISSEIAFKQRLIDESLESNASTSFLIAKIQNEVVGVISVGPCGKEIMDCTHQEWAALKEIGSLYVHPQFQNQGIGSLLIHTAVKKLDEQGIDEFCLDSGYQHAQTKWCRKFGEPTMIVKDYWGKGLDHMLWRIKVKDILM
jgi:GNAT superfamily N-acetyltransferase